MEGFPRERENGMSELVFGAEKRPSLWVQGTGPGHSANLDRFARRGCAGFSVSTLVLNTRVQARL